MALIFDEDASKEPVLDKRDQQVMEWRKSQLRRAGVDEEAVEILANIRQVDVRWMVDLLERGCSVTQLLRILT